MKKKNNHVEKADEEIKSVANVGRCTSKGLESSSLPQQQICKCKCHKSSKIYVENHCEDCIPVSREDGLDGDTKQNKSSKGIVISTSSDNQDVRVECLKHKVLYTKVDGCSLCNQDKYRQHYTIGAKR